MVVLLVVAFTTGSFILDYLVEVPGLSISASVIGVSTVVVDVDALTT